MTALKTSAGIVPGVTLYYVNGTRIAREVHNSDIDIDKFISEYIIDSCPEYKYHSKTVNTLFVRYIGGSFSLKDCGICDDKNFTPYNLNRLFISRYEAAEFVSQCIIGKFFDYKDQLEHDQTKGYWYAPYIPVQVIGNPVQSNPRVLKHKGTI